MPWLQFKPKTTWVIHIMSVCILHLYCFLKVMKVKHLLWYAAWREALFISQVVQCKENTVTVWYITNFQRSLGRSPQMIPHLLSQQDMSRIIELCCVRAVFGLLTKYLCSTPGDFSCTSFVDCVNECQCCKPVFMNSVSSLGQWILCLPLKGNGLLTAYPEEVALFLWAWGVTERNERTDGPRKNWILWCVVSDRASGWCVLMSVSWTEPVRSNSEHAVKLQGYTLNTVK